MVSAPRLPLDAMLLVRATTTTCRSEPIAQFLVEDKEHIYGGDLSGSAWRLSSLPMPRLAVVKACLLACAA